MGYDTEVLLRRVGMFFPILHLGDALGTVDNHVIAHENVSHAPAASCDSHE